ncbi:MAG: LPS export ABC transporter periplasmic protein LptC [Acidobacteriota bacterium]|nr:MAG: LPS export ABC transporter periplasmic protein LptC [Acidobacteriota bacterium]
MTEDKKNDLEKFHLRARLPYILRGVAIVGGIAAVLAVAVGLYLGSFRQEFRMKSLPTTLSENVVAVVNGYERKESENSVLKYVIRADKATTFDDEHQELEKVILEVYADGDVSKADKLRADKAIYVPVSKDSKDFRIFFAGNVVIDTRDRLNVRTDQLTYTKSTETADAEEYLQFSRENISGNAVGAVVRIEQETLELLSDVEIFAGPGEPRQDFAQPELKAAELKAGKAFVDQKAGTIDLTGNVDVFVVPQKGSDLERPTRIEGSTARAFLEDKQLRKVEVNGSAKVTQEKDAAGGFTNASARKITAHIDEGLSGLDLEGEVSIESAAGREEPSRIVSNTAEYRTAGEVFELDGNVRIDSVSNARKTSIAASHAVYRQKAGEVYLTGGATVTQGTDTVGGSQINATLFPDRGLRTAEVLGSAFLRQATKERRSQLNAPEIRSRFAKNGNISSAVALGGSEIEVIPLGRVGYSKYSLTTRTPLEMLFAPDGKPATAKSKGRTTIRLVAEGSGPDVSDKIITADSVNSKFRAGTDELDTAEANGNAELVIIPKSLSQGKYRTQINSPRFVCDFYGANNARSCTGAGSSTARRKPLWGNAGPDQILNANRFVASFDQNSQDISSLEAIGSAKFSEGNRNGIADRIRFVSASQTASLRGGEPVLWDDSGRVRAKEIDWDVRNERSSMAGGVSATYHKQRADAASTPFAEANSPVFVSSQSAQFDHKAETAVFTGNARAWQDNNYVRGDRLLIDQAAGRFYAEGNVESLLYDAQRTVGGKRTSVPVYAAAGSMLYIDGDRLLRYQKGVDIRQGTDRIRAGSASVTLNRNNELVSTVAEKNVEITQPGRRATGSYARYDTAEEVIVLRGDPATVSDQERGSSRGREVVVNLKQKLITGSGGDGQGGTGRIRSVYKLKEGERN